MPAVPPGGQGFGDRAELTGRDELAVGGAQDPQPVRRQGQPRREAAAVRGEEQDRVRGRHDIQFGHVIGPARETWTARTGRVSGCAAAVERRLRGSVP